MGFHECLFSRQIGQNSQADPPFPMQNSIARWIPLLLILGSVPVGAQEVLTGKAVRVRAPSVLIERFEGVYTGRSGDTVFFWNDKGGPVNIVSSAITQLDVKTRKSRLRGSLLGAFWGGAIMAVLLPLVATPFVGGEISTVELILGGAAQGVMAGAVIGAFVPAPVWRAADPRILLQAVRSNVGGRVTLAF